MAEPQPPEPGVPQALAAASAWIGTVPGVVMVGEGRDDAGQAVIDVWVTRPVRLPQQLHGIEVRVRDAGGEMIAEAGPAAPQ